MGVVASSGAELFFLGEGGSKADRGGAWCLPWGRLPGLRWRQREPVEGTCLEQCPDLGIGHVVTKPGSVPSTF